MMLAFDHAMFYSDKECDTLCQQPIRTQAYTYYNDVTVGISRGFKLTVLWVVLCTWPVHLIPLLNLYNLIGSFFDV